MTVSPDSDFAPRLDLLEASRQVAGTFPERKPAFTFLVGWSDSYEDLFEGSHTHVGEIAEILETAARRGRVIVHGDGGSGKTTIVHRLFAAALERDWLPIVIDLKAWRAPHFSEWARYEENQYQRTAILLSGLGTPQVSEETLRAVSDGLPIVVFVDGLSELPSATGQEIVDVVDDLGRRIPEVALVVADRLVRRNIRLERWSLARVRALDPQQVEALAQEYGVIRGDRTPGELLSIPFFLDWSISQGREVTSTSEFHELFLSKQLSLEEKEILALAEAAFNAYEQTLSRTFPVSLLMREAGERATQILIDSRVVIREDGECYFAHQLQHDFLASLFLAQHPDREWTHHNFDVVTFRASSFDSLAMTLEQLADRSLAERFVRNVYDWNFYGAAYVLARGRELDSSRVTPEIETAILAMLAEKRWDIIEATAQRVSDALRLFPSTESHALLQAQNLDEVFGLLWAKDTEVEWFDSWRSLFTTEPGSSADDETVRRIEEPDSLTGWTLANVLKRLSLSGPQQHMLRTILASGADPVRWRVAHTLGAFPSAANRDALLQALDHDAYDWVRYGALRSLIELAARSADADLCHSVFAALLSRTTALRGDKRTLDEFERAVFVRNMPSYWADDAQPILQELWRTAVTLPEQEHWQLIGLRLRQLDDLSSPP